VFTVYVPKLPVVPLFCAVIVVPAVTPAVVIGDTESARSFPEVTDATVRAVPVVVQAVLLSQMYPEKDAVAPAVCDGLTVTVQGSVYGRVLPQVPRPVIVVPGTTPLPLSVCPTARGVPELNAVTVSVLLLGPINALKDNGTVSDAGGTAVWIIVTAAVQGLV